MKERLIFILLASLLIGSCKKICRTCTCTKGTQTFTEKNCALGRTGKKNLNTWERYLKEEKGYDTVICKDN